MARAASHARPQRTPHRLRSRVLRSFLLRSCLLRSFLPIAAVALTLAGPAAAADDIVETLADTYAGWAMAHGRAVGVGVAVVIGDQPTRTFTYGAARVDRDGAVTAPMTPDTLFEIASHSKVFTTNLLGQFVAEGKLRLDDPLSRFADRIGPFGNAVRLKGAITLGQLGSFTAGLVDTPDHCGPNQSPDRSGCIPPHPNYYPPISEYGAAQFLTYFRTHRPRNFQTGEPATSLPAPYLYSNFSTTLLGLLLGTPDGERISDRSVHRWFALVKSRLLEPLGLTDTFLRIPPAARHRLAGGYNRAYARAIVAEGRVQSIEVLDPGSDYDPRRPPIVTISGGGGSGATAVAEVDRGGRIARIRVVSGGEGYVGNASVWKRDPATGKLTPLSASVAVRDGAVAGVVLEGYEDFAPGTRVVITGGRRSDATPPARARLRRLGRDAQFVEVTHGGSGYVEPLTVRIAPGAPVETAHSVFAPAAALNSSIRDMARLVRAAMGERVVEGRRVPAIVRRGFEIARTPYACEGPSAALAGCTGARVDGLSAMAWQVFPGRPGQPTVVLKNGIRSGFTSQTLFSPELRIGVVVLTSSDQYSYTGYWISDALFFDLYFRCLAGADFFPPRRPGGQASTSMP